MYTEYDRRPHLVEEREAILFTVEVKQLPHVDVCVVLDTKLGDVKYVTCNTWKNNNGITNGIFRMLKFQLKENFFPSLTMTTTTVDSAIRFYVLGLWNENPNNVPYDIRVNVLYYYTLYGNISFHIILL